LPAQAVKLLGEAGGELAVHVNEAVAGTIAS
jgi:hypothetical protein